jgi:hypothetical protein
MAGLAPQHSKPSQLGGNKPILLQLEEQYTKRVDDDVLKLVDSFADIIRVTEVNKHVLLLDSRSIRIQLASISNLCSLSD